MSEDYASDPIQQQPALNLNPALGLAILGGFALGMVILLKKLPAHHLSKSDMDRLLFYRYLREKGKLES